MSCPHCGAVQRQSDISISSTGTLWLPLPSFFLGLLSVLALFVNSPWDADTYIGVLSFIITAIVIGSISISIQKRGQGLSAIGIILGIIGLLGVIGRAFN